MSESIKINKTTLTFNKIWYVDANNGNDTSGDGSKANPYKTLSTCYSKITSGDCIKLGDGTYDASSFSYDKTVSIIGNYNKTTFIQGNYVYTNNYSGVTIKFYRLIVKGYSEYGISYFQLIYPYSQAGKTTIEYYNCIIRFGDYLHVMGGINEIHLTNCYIQNTNSWQTTITAPNPKNNSYNTSAIVINNCYTTISAYWNYTSANTAGYSIYYSQVYNLQFNTPQLDIDYNILQSGWKNLGYDTIIDPDGNRSSVGVYGGPFAWGIWPNTKISLNKIIPRHLYQLGKDSFGIDVSCFDEDTLAKVQFKLMKDGVDISPLGLESLRSSISGMSVGENIIKIRSSDNVEIPVTIIKEPLYRTSSERTFLKIDGGYNKNNIDNSNNKIDIPPVIKTISNTKEISLNQTIKKLSLS